MPTTCDLRHVCFEGKLAAGNGQMARRSSRPPTVSAHSPLPPTEPAHGFVAWIINRAGLDANFYRHGPLLRRLPACLRMLRVRSTEEARGVLEQRPELLPAAVDSLLIGVTEFFRDLPVFEGMRAAVLPSLALRRGPLRVWSAACSNGEELYSVAILLAEGGLLAGSLLLGTDCRTRAVERARAGLYNAAPADQTIRKKYFEPEGKSWRVVGSLQRQASWEVADLAEKVAGGPWDIILWRNLAIYLNAGPAEILWKRLAEALSPEGFLIVGKAERPPSALDLVPVCRCIYRRRPAAQPLPEEDA